MHNVTILVQYFTDGCMREIKAEVWNASVRLRLNGVSWSVVACLSVADTVLLAECARALQRPVDTHSPRGYYPDKPTEHTQLCNLVYIYISYTITYRNFNLVVSGIFLAGYESANWVSVPQYSNRLQASHTCFQLLHPKWPRLAV